MSSVKKVLEETLALPREDREEIVSALSRSLDSIAMSPEWEAEIVRRVQGIEDGTAVVHDAEEHLKDLRAKYGG